MSNLTYAIVSERPWHADLPERLESQFQGHFLLLDRKEQLTSNYLGKLQPRYVFFAHWSHRIPADIHDRFECVVFHMTDVPYGRGGSPLQNLIARGHSETMMSALRCVEEMDAGPVYLKQPLALYGSAEEIFMRAASVIKEMIAKIIQYQPVPHPQEGDPVIFRRRKPEDGDLRQVDSLDGAFDHIRMLDAAGYPPAFIETGGYRFEFKRANRRVGHIEADVAIKKIDENAQE